MKPDDQPKICVAIRKRPLNRKEIIKNENDIICVKNQQTVIVSEYKQKVDLTKYIEESIFNFDYAFDENSQNEQIYAKAVRPLVQSAFQGARVTCFAYGQTGSGKTYTMNGDIQNGVAGLYTLGAQDIFSLLKQTSANLKVFVSFFEIYCGKLFDLLNNRGELKIRQDNKQNVHIVGLQQKQLYSPKQFMNVIEYGSSFRVTSQNSTNADSSRSHAILQIALKDGKKIFGKISFIDLAGCERGADHMDQNKQTRIDGAEINKSLLALKQCIRALDQGKGHTPFRGSKLTMVLKDSFIGFCKTVMIGNISPGLGSCQNTLNTLRYADRVKQLKKSSGGQQMSKEDQLAKQLMLPRMNKNAIKINIENGDDAEDIIMKKMEAHKKILGAKNVVNQEVFNSSSYHSTKLSDQTNIQKNPKLTQQKNDEKRGDSVNTKMTFGNKIASLKLRNHQESPKVVNTKVNTHQYSQSPGKTNIFNKTFQTKNSFDCKTSRNTEQQIKPKNTNLSSFRGQTTGQRHNSLTKSNLFSANLFGQSRENYSQKGNFLGQSLYQPKRQTVSASQFDWNVVVNEFREWHPHNEKEMIYFRNCHQQMINKLMKQQDVIISEHSMTINREIEVIKSEMKFIGEMQRNKENTQSIEYAQFMEDMIDSKLSLLLELKKKIKSFKQKLIEHQECQEKIFMAKDQLAEEQLLEDIINDE